MKTFHIQTLGCKVNHYESEQIATLLISRGLIPSDAGSADIRVINTCSVTTQAASQSRQSVRRMVRLPVLQSAAARSSCTALSIQSDSAADSTQPLPPSQPAGSDPIQTSTTHRPRVLVTGCWATSNPADASALPGVDGVVGHHHDVALELDRLLKQWQDEEASHSPQLTDTYLHTVFLPPEPLGIENKRKDEAATPVGKRSKITAVIEPKPYEGVNVKVGEEAADGWVKVQSVECRAQSDEETGARKTSNPASPTHSSLFNLHSSLTTPGSSSLPLLHHRQPGRQRAFLKIQDGCDAHCTYCIIPSLRPTLWSKPVDSVVEEATALVAAGHVEIILTGIFLGAYGQPTALRRRQPQSTAKPLGQLIESLCTRVPGLKRLRLSSLEPGDLTEELIAVLRSHKAVVPHFHLPLQSGSNGLLRKMNRQYTREDFLQMVDRINAAFDRPALTTDVVAGFPGETDEEFQRTAEVVRTAGFIHVHAFPYSPRPGTAAARWTKHFIRGPVVNERIEHLRQMAEEQSFAYRQTFLGQTVEVIVERDSENVVHQPTAKHGRCERYFSVMLDEPKLQPGQSALTEISRVTIDQTMGRVL